MHKMYSNYKKMGVIMRTSNYNSIRNAFNIKDKIRPDF